MPREKVIKFKDASKIIYDDARWELLKELRMKAREVMRSIPVNSYVHGSVARGDVTKRSDIDIVILENIPSYIIESYLDYENRYLVQATPNSAIKALYEIDSNINVVFPLTPLNRREYEFYDFGGKSDLLDEKRVMGINKKLLFIEPSEDGHIEWSIIGREHEAAKKLGIGVETIEERIRVLTRRDKIGRTGIYLKECVPPNRGVEEYLKILADRDPVIRRMVRKR